MGKHLSRSLFINKVGLQTLGLQIYQKRDSDPGAFLWFFAKFFKNTFFKELVNIVDFNPRCINPAETIYVGELPD